MMNPNEASVNPREKCPLSRNILHSCGFNDHGTTGQRMSRKVSVIPTGYRGWLLLITSPKVSAGYLTYPADVRDSAKSGLGQKGNRHLRYLVESISVNVGGSRWEGGSHLMKSGSVGGVIVVRGWESQPQGEGRQLVGIPMQMVTEC
jgi:hypothetical protein